MPSQHGPQRIEPESPGDYLEVMSKAVLQSGISWRVVETKWPEIREAFRGFDTETVANFTPSDLEELVQDKRVIRNRRKLDAIVTNAQRIVELDEAHGGFRGYLRSHDTFAETVTDLRKRFKYLGDTGCYFFLYVVGEEVPSYEEWFASRGMKRPGTPTTDAS